MTVLTHDRIREVLRPFMNGEPSHELVLALFAVVMEEVAGAVIREATRCAEEARRGFEDFDRRELDRTASLSEWLQQAQGRLAHRIAGRIEARTTGVKP